MQSTLTNPDECNLRIYQIPLSGIKINGAKINYYDFIYSLENKDCNKALKRLLPKIDLSKINKIIDDTPYITELQKRFYKKVLKERKEKILDISFKKLCALENTKG